MVIIIHEHLKIINPVLPSFNNLNFSRILFRSTFLLTYIKYFFFAQKFMLFHHEWKHLYVLGIIFNIIFICFVRMKTSMLSGKNKPESNSNSNSNHKHPAWTRCLGRGTQCPRRALRTVATLAPPLSTSKRKALGNQSFISRWAWRASARMTRTIINSQTLIWTNAIWPFFPGICLALCPQCICPCPKS